MNTNNYRVHYNLNGKDIVKTYTNISEQTLKHYIELYQNLSQSTYVSHEAF